MKPVMNNTKWEELRLAMYGLGDLRPSWRTRELSGYLSPWDTEWFYHFRLGGYRAIEWVELRTTSLAQNLAVLAVLREIHVPGELLEQGFRIYGYSTNSSSLSYI